MANKVAIRDVLRVMQEHDLSTIDMMGIMVAIDKLKLEEKKYERLQNNKKR